MRRGEMVFVIVHGAWSGGWFMTRLSKALRQRGAEVFTPTLTGLGEREHLATTDVGLSTHIEDVRAVLYYEDLWDVILVGHSYGGAVATGVADRSRDRIRRLIYFDAFVLRNGESLADTMNPELTKVFQDIALREGDGWRAPSPFTMEQFGVTDANDVAWATRRMTLHPLKTLIEPIALGSQSMSIPVSYVLCTAPRLGLFDQFAVRAATEGWDCHQMSAPHAAPAVEPDKCADLLLKLGGLESRQASS